MKNHWINKWNEELEMPDIRSQRFWKKLNIPDSQWEEAYERDINPENLVLAGVISRWSLEATEIYHESLAKKASI